VIQFGENFFDEETSPKPEKSDQKSEKKEFVP